MRCPYCFGQGDFCTYCYGTGEKPIKIKKRGATVSDTPAWIKLPSKPSPVTEKTYRKRSFNFNKVDYVNHWRQKPFVPAVPKKSKPFVPTLPKYALICKSCGHRKIIEPNDLNVFQEKLSIGTLSYRNINKLRPHLDKFICSLCNEKTVTLKQIKS